MGTNLHFINSADFRSKSDVTLTFIGYKRNHCSKRPHIRRCCVSFSFLKKCWKHIIVLYVAFWKSSGLRFGRYFEDEKTLEIKPPLPTTYRQSFWSHVASSSHTLVSGIILVLRLLIQQFSNSKITQFYVIGQFWSWMQHYVFRFEISVKDILGMQIFKGWR